MIQTIFDENEKVYGSRKIKRELKKLGQRVSRRRISRLMSELGLVSVYTIAQYKVHKDKCNEDPVPNVLNRDFTSQAPVKRIVSDLTYVRVGNDWNYICLLTDLYNREIISDTAVEDTKTLSWLYEPSRRSKDRYLKSISFIQTEA